MSLPAETDTHPQSSNGQRGRSRRSPIYVSRCIRPISGLRVANRGFRGRFGWPMTKNAFGGIGTRSGWPVWRLLPRGRSGDSSHQAVLSLAAADVLAPGINPR
jgi:hypothetical protein